MSKRTLKIEVRNQRAQQLEQQRASIYNEDFETPMQPGTVLRDFWPVFCGPGGAPRHPAFAHLTAEQRMDSGRHPHYSYQPTPESPFHVSAL